MRLSRFGNMESETRVWVQHGDWDLAIKRAGNGQSSTESPVEAKEDETVVSVRDLAHQRVYRFSCSLQSNIGVLKKEIEKQSGMAPKIQRLFAPLSKGKPLEDSHPLRKLKDENSAAIQLLLAGQRNLASVRRLVGNSSTWWYLSSGAPDPVAHSSSMDAITFTVDQPITIAGIGLSNSPEETEYQTYFALVSGNPSESGVAGSELASETISWQSGTDHETVYEALFRSPVDIQPDTEYSLVILTVGKQSYYGVEGKEEVTDPETGVTFRFHDASCSPNCTDVGSGQIQVIYFYA